MLVLHYYKAMILNFVFICRELEGTYCALILLILLTDGLDGDWTLVGQADTRGANVNHSHSGLFCFFVRLMVLKRIGRR